jgi:hypothetical protein
MHGHTNVKLKQYVHYFELFMKLQRNAISWFTWCYKKKALPVHAMEAGKGNRGIAPLILNLGTR